MRRLNVVVATMLLVVCVLGLTHGEAHSLRSLSGGELSAIVGGAANCQQCKNRVNCPIDLYPDLCITATHLRCIGVANPWSNCVNGVNLCGPPICWGWCGL